MASKARSKKKPVRSKPSTVMPSRSFDVLVLATMSAGKTSFINALIGQELLHAANEATTACLTRVEHRSRAKAFGGVTYCHDERELERHAHTTREQMCLWNADAGVKKIHLSGRFRSTPRQACGLVLHDTPGPNNSQDERHERLMFEALGTVSFKVLCYVLNASQLGTTDDRALLAQVRERLAQRSGYQWVFILNKVDLLDPERGEGIATCVANARAYLQGLGFEQPIIIPTMANAALYARKALDTQPLTRVERSRLHQALGGLDEYKQHLSAASDVPAAIGRQVAKDLRQLEKACQAKPVDCQSRETLQLQQLIACSGIRTVETLIKHQRRLVISA
ncbi:dynamin family protein [Pseudomonas capeferrum]